MVYDPSFVVV